MAPNYYISEPNFKSLCQIEDYSGLSMDYMNEICARRCLVGRLKRKGSSNVNIEEIIEPLPYYEERFQRKHPKLKDKIISFAKPGHLARFNKAIDMYNTFSPNSRLLDVLHVVFNEYFREIITGNDMREC